MPLPSHMKKPIILFISIVIVIITGLEYYALLIRKFALEQTENFIPENFEVIYKSSILNSSGDYANFVVIGSLICGFATLIVTKRLHILLRIGIVLVTVIGLMIAVFIFNRLIIWAL
jgi:hypothetical protein